MHKLDLSHLTKNADSFEQSLNKTLNAAVRCFKDEYLHIFGDLIEKIMVDEQETWSHFIFVAYYT